MSNSTRRLKRWKKKIEHLATGVKHAVKHPKRSLKTYAKYAPLQITGPLAIHHGTTHIPHMAVGVARGKGLVFPGTSYIGPGNPLLSGRPRSYHDNLARTHDYQYSYLLEKGRKPYFTWNKADQEIVRKADPKTIEGAAVLMGIGSKRVFPTDNTPVPKIAPYQSKEGRRQTAREKRGRGSHMRSARTLRQPAGFSAKTGDWDKLNK